MKHWKLLKEYIGSSLYLIPDMAPEVYFTEGISPEYTVDNPCLLYCLNAYNIEKIIKPSVVMRTRYGTDYTSSTAATMASSVAANSYLYGLCVINNIVYAVLKAYDADGALIETKTYTLKCEANTQFYIYAFNYTRGSAGARYDLYEASDTPPKTIDLEFLFRNYCNTHNATTPEENKFHKTFKLFEKQEEGKEIEIGLLGEKLTTPKTTCYLKFAHKKQGAEPVEVYKDNSTSYAFKYARITLYDNKNKMAFYIYYYDEDGELLGKKDIQPGLTLNWGTDAIQVYGLYCMNERVNNYLIPTQVESIPVNYSLETERYISTDIRKTAETVRTISAGVKKEIETYNVVNIFGIYMNYQNLSTRPFKNYEPFSYEEIERGDIVSVVELNADIIADTTLTADGRIYEAQKIPFIGKTTLQAKHILAKTVRADIKNTSSLEADAYANADIKANIKATTVVEAESYKVLTIQAKANINANTVLEAPYFIQPIAKANIYVNTNVIAIPTKIKRRTDEELIMTTLSKDFEATVIFAGEIENKYYPIKLYQDRFYSTIDKKWGDLSFSKNFVLSKTTTMRKE